MDDEWRANIKVILSSSYFFTLSVLVLGHLPLVHRVEVEVGIISPDRSGEMSESILEATST